MKRYFWPITGSALSFLLSVLLMLSPWTYVLNVSGHPWSNATETFFWSGLGMAVITLLALIFWITALRHRWAMPEPVAQVDGAPRQEPRGNSQTASPTQPAPTSDEDLWEQELRQLAQEVLHDISGHQDVKSASLANTSTFEGRD